MGIYACYHAPKRRCPLNRQGFPLAHEVFEGDVEHRETLGRMLDLLGERVGFAERQTAVVDRGMAFEENLRQLKEPKLHYVVATRQSERDAWLRDFEDEEGFEEIHRDPSPLNPFQKKSRILLKRKCQGDEAYILCVSSERGEKDRGIREKQDSRLLGDMEKLRQRIADKRLVEEVAVGEAMGRLKERYPRVPRYHRICFDRNTGELTRERNEALRGKARMLDGAYLLRTDRVDVTGEEAWLWYMTLTRAENAFRAMKSPLAERLIFHRLEHRVEADIFLCVLAYHLLAAIETALRERDCHSWWATAGETLAGHQVATIVLPADNGAVLKIRKGTAPEPQHVELYRLLDVPTEIIPPQKKWILPQALSPGD